MSESTATYGRLAARFAASDHKTRKQGGRDLTYVTGEMVVSRLNEVLGFDWSFRVVREGATEVEAWVLGELDATIDGRHVVRQQYGNQDLARGQHPTTDLFKSAATDALKKCATTIGVALYLYDEDERREVEQEMREARRSGPKPPATASTSSARTTAPSPTAAARGVPPEVDASAKLTGAPTPPTPAGYFCVECETLVRAKDTVHIPKKRAADSPMVDVAVSDFAPVCEERLGGFYCGPCYTKKWTAAA